MQLLVNKRSPGTSSSATDIFSAPAKTKRRTTENPAGRVNLSGSADALETKVVEQRCPRSAVAGRRWGPRGLGHQTVWPRPGQVGPRCRRFDPPGQEDRALLCLAD